MRLHRQLLPLLIVALVACGGEDAGTAGDPVEPASAPVPEAPAGDTEGDGAAPPEVALGDGTAGREPLRVAFVYVGTPGDPGWTDQHDQGRQLLEAELGDQVEVTAREGIEEGPGSERVFDGLARQGNDVIIATSPGYRDQVAAVAGRHPEVVFEHAAEDATGDAAGDVAADNLGSYAGAAEQGRYLEGMAAAAASATGELGFVAAFPTPEVIRGINAYTLGARQVNPEATVRVAWTSTWYDPEVERAAAERLLDAGVDVLGMHQDSPAVGLAAQAAGAGWTGYGSDMEDLAPEAWLTATTWRWGPYYVGTVQSVLDGTWTPQAYRGDMADGTVGLAPFGERVPEEVRDEIEARRTRFITGELAPFSGPILTQEGAERAADDEELSPEEVRAMDFLVDGVIGDLPP